MLDHLIESREHSAERKKLAGYMLCALTIVIFLLTSITIYSLFSRKLALGAENLEISTLIAPVEITPKAQPLVETKQKEPDRADAPKSDVPTRQTAIQRMAETPFEVPDTISVTPTNQKARPNSPYIINGTDSDPDRNFTGEKGYESGTSQSGGKGLEPVLVATKPTPETIDTPPPVQRPKPAKQPPPVTGGVVNGKATHLVRPAYSAAAKGLGVKGEVRVRVLIDEDGNVISADVESGHALLRGSAINAARASKFTPTTLSQQKVKVSGVIVYNFS